MPSYTVEITFSDEPLKPQRLTLDAMNPSIALELAIDYAAWNPQLRVHYERIDITDKINNVTIRKV